MAADKKPIPFKFSNEKQREINAGQTIDPGQQNKRKTGRHNRHLKLSLSIRELRKIQAKLPEGIAVQTYELTNEYGETIPSTTEEYFTHKPIIITLICSEVHPFPLARNNEYDLQNIITEHFGNHIITENVTKKDCPNLDEESSLLFRHEGLMQLNEATGQDKLNKSAFNVRPFEVQERDIDFMNKKLEILGYRINKKDALLKMGNINQPKKYTFEYAEY